MTGEKRMARACVVNWKRGVSSLIDGLSFSCILLFALFASLPIGFVYASSYTYDSAGRLKSVTNSQGQTATYNYDSRGNITSVERKDSTQVAIASFAPNNGPPGIQVTIDGEGFAEGAADNTVTFNGTSAPVLAASSTQLLVQVPQNVTTGPISVENASGSATSTDEFYVSTAGSPPSISGFTPTSGNIGDTITINGQNLSPIVGESVVTVNGIFVPISTISNLQITIAIPPWAGSGIIEVTTPYGMATTAAALYVIPYGYSPSSTAITAPLTADGSSESVNLNAQTPNAIFSFSGEADEYASLQGTSFSNADDWVQVSIYDPMGVLIASTSIDSSNPTIHLPRMTMKGSYSVMLSQSASPQQVSLALDPNPEIVLDGASTVLPTTGIAQRKRLYFYVPAVGQDIGLGIDNLSVSNGNGWVIVSVYDSNGVEWTWTECQVPQCNLNLINAPRSGPFTVQIDPNNATATFQLTATLSNSVLVTLPPTNTPRQMNLIRKGQNGLYTFSGTAGQSIALNLVPNGNLGFDIINPDGTTLVSPAWMTTSTYNLTLPQTGNYTIYVWPRDEMASVTATLVVDAAAVPLTTNGSASAVANQIGGQVRYVSFNATSGENLGLGISNLDIENGGGFVNVEIIRPSGVNWMSGQCGPPRCNFNLWNAPETGTYTVVIDPIAPTATFSLSANVSDSVVVALPTTGVPTLMNLAIPGQTGIYTFSATAGQVMAVNLTPTGNLGASIVNPDGSTLIPGAWADGSTYNMGLEQTGTYRIYVWPGSAPASMTAELVMDAVPVSITTNGSSAAVSNQIGGQFGFFAFSATAGENLGLGISNRAIQNGGSFVNVEIKKPDGTRWTNGQCAPPQCNFALWNAPATGTYSVVVEPQTGTSTFSLSVNVSDSTSVSLPVSGVPTSMNLPIPGQTGIYTFSGMAGQVIAVNFTPNGHLGVDIVNPDGSTLLSPLWADGSTYNLGLTQTGTYTVYVWPGDAPASLTTTLGVDGPPVPLTTDGGSSPVSTQVGGQFGYFTFNATAGDSLGLEIGNLVIQNSGGFVNVQINEPNGSRWTSGECAPPECNFTLWNAPASGTYTVVVEPTTGTGTFSFVANVSNSLTVALPAANVPFTMNLAIPGEIGTYSFSGSAGQLISLKFAVLTGGNSNIGIAAYNPDGTTLIGATWAGSSAYVMTLSQTGSYTIQVWLNNGVPGSITARLASLSANTWGGIATFDPNDAANQFTLSNNSNTVVLSSSVGGGNAVSAFGNTGVNSDKWVYRVHVDSATADVGVGIAQLGTPTSPNAFYSYAAGYAVTASGSAVNSGNNISEGTNFGAGSVIDVAYDASNGNLWIAVNGVWIDGGDPVAGILPLYTGLAPGYYVPAVSAAQVGDGFTLQPAPTLVGYTAWPGQYSSTNIVDTVGHTVTANGTALVSNIQPKFGYAPSGASDPSFALVKLLLHFEEPAAIASSGAFISAGSSYLTIPNSPDFDLTSGDWTIETFVYPTSLNSDDAEILCKDGQAYVSFSQYDLELAPSGQLVGRIGTGTGTGALQTITSTDAVPLYTWSHVVFERSGNTISLYINGVLEASATVSITMTGRSQPLFIGRQQDQGASNFFDGYIDELRVTKGLARYSGSSFTVPTSAFPDQ